MTEADSAHDRARGALVGLAAGDAVGTTVEFCPPGTFEPVTDMVGGGPFSLAAGQWTDDTSMALCLAESLVECDGHDPGDQMRRYLRWWREGYFSATGRCFDIGTTTRTQLARFERTGEPHDRSIDEEAAANGSLMRLAPVAIRWAHDSEAVVEQAAASSRPTHAARRPVDACKLLAAMTAALIRGEPLAAVFDPGFWSQGDGARFEGYWSHAKGATARIRDYAPTDATLHGIADRLQAIQRRNFYQLAAEVSHRGRYYHEYAMSVDVTRDSPTWQPPTEDAEEIVTEALRDLARWLYRQLQAEYDHLTSDEAIEEGIIVNEYTFTEGGRRFG